MISRALPQGNCVPVTWPDLDFPYPGISHELAQSPMACPVPVTWPDWLYQTGTMCCGHALWSQVALHPLREATYDLINDLLDEVTSIFPDSYLHLGGDEVDGDCWLSDEQIAQWASNQQRREPHANWKHALQVRVA